MGLTRITLEEAKQYVSCQDDFSSDGIENAEFFTLTPEEDGWEIVTYYTPRKINIYANRNKEYDSWVYVLSNPTLPNMLKIGYTRNHPEERAQQISSSTGVALPYKVEFAFRCFNGFDLEQQVHRKLKSYRVNNNREFFQISLEEAKKIIEKFGERYL